VIVPKMSLIGTDFAYSHMQGLGWSQGKGLGKNHQGIVDAIKPKLKFDQTGVGHNRAEEFEFHWWDHVFNKAAKNIKVDESESGDIKVEMNLDKSELSTKKMRKKMMKKVRNQLYSNFVKSGTLTGGKMEEVQKEEDEYVVDKDLSKIKELSDDQLVAACGGMTAHKGGRHGLNMKAKLDRIAEAEKEFLEKYGGGVKSDLTPSPTDVTAKKKKKKRKHDETKENVGADVSLQSESEFDGVKKKKKKKDKNMKEIINSVETIETVKVKEKKKKKHKKTKHADNEN